MGAPDSQIMNYVLRMVIPMRREFGRVLDVPHFLHDRVYAQEVLREAAGSQDQRLRDYAALLEKQIFGPRHNLHAGQPAVTSPPLAGPAAPPPAADDGDDTDAERLKAKVLKKYTGGLR